MVDGGAIVSFLTQRKKIAISKSMKGPIEEKYFDKDRTPNLNFNAG